MTENEKQRKIKPKIDDAISKHLDGENKNRAIDFIEYLRANKMSPHWISTDSWKSSFKQKLVCFIRIKEGYWNIRPALYNTSNPCDPVDFDRFITEQNLEEFIWRNIKTCENCLPCSPGKSITVAGKEFNNKCGYQTIQIVNPNDTDIDNIKKILEYKQNGVLKNL